MQYKISSLKSRHTVEYRVEDDKKKKAIEVLLLK